MMMPSRGVTALRGIAPRLRCAQSRSFSLASTTRQNLTSPLQRASRPRQHILFPGLVVTSLHAVRNASTATSTPAAASTPPSASPDFASPAPNSSIVPNLDSLTLDDIDFSADALAKLEHVGYLKELGIDYGWGITSTIQWMLENFHAEFGMPWWGAIAAAAAVVRIVTLPLAIRASDMSAKSTAMMEVLKPIGDRIKQAQKEGNTQLMQMEAQNLLAARSQAGISFTSMLIPPVVQGIVGYCGFRLMRAMATLPVPGLQDGGFLWMTDLTVPDGYLILPAIMAVSTHLLFRFGSETGTAQLSGGMKSFMLYGMPGLIFIFTGWQPAALGIWFTASGGLAMATGLALRRPAVRRLVRITPMYQPPPGQTTSMADLVGSMTGTSAQAAAKPQPKPGHMRPTYQAPNLRRSGGETRTIDTTLVKSEAPPAPKKGIFDSIKTSVKSVGAQADAYGQKRAEKQKKKLREDAVQKAVEARRDRAKR